MPTSALPHLDPRVPVLDRGTDALQVGLNADQAVVLTGPADPLRAALGLMDGHHGPARIARGSGLELGLVEAIVTALDDRGLLVTPPPPRLAVRIVGSGALARDLAEAVCATDLGELTVVDPEPPAPRVYAHPRATGGASLRAHLVARGHRVRSQEHWFGRGDTHQVTVVADDRLEPDRALTEVLTRDGIPHLTIRPTVRGVVVGPFVVPGRTACMRCLDLVLAADPAWPAILAQLCRARLTLPATVRAWAVAQALVCLRAWATGGVPLATGTTVELAADCTVHQRRWPRHPLCTCDELAAA